MLLSEIQSSLQTLVEHAWDNEISWSQIEGWARNFDGQVVAEDQEQLYNLFALSRFMYFGKRQIREMLKALYRDHFESPLIQRIRRNCGNTRDVALLRRMYHQELTTTRFCGVGNPSESGAHLLYYFRQVNYLRKDLFADFSSSFVARPDGRGALTHVKYAPTTTGITRYVLFDDVVGSGVQARTYLSGMLTRIRRDNPNVELKFMSLFATTEGLAKMNSTNMFDGNAMCLFELDDSYKAFSSNSRHFSGAPSWFVPADLLRIALHYGTQIQPDKALGYRDGQLMLGMSHNTPDNTLPIFWDEGHGCPWQPAFVRYDKVYSSVAP